MADKPWIPDDWTFRNAGVASRFDDHVRETLPWYDLATHGVAHFLRAYVPEGGLVYDIGASTGNVARSVAETIESRSLRFVGIEPSKQMVDIYDAPGEIVQANAKEFPFEEFDVAVGKPSGLAHPIQCFLDTDPAGHALPAGLLVEEACDVEADLE